MGFDMTAYKDLQEAAKYAAQDTIKFADESEEMRALQQFHEEVEPGVVLALIAENERLQSAARTLAHLRYTDNGGELWRPPLGKKPDFNLMDQLKGENEALREEVALDDKLIADRDRLLNMFECPAHGQCIPYAMEQVEALRKDAEQWRALVGRSKSPVIGFTGCVICGVYTDHGGLPCPKTRATADAAMGKGEQS
jgi:hypothetical protein